MSPIEKFHHGMMVSYAKSFLHERMYEIHSEGDIRINLPDHLGIGYDLSVWLVASGSQSALVSVVAPIPIAFPKREWLRGLTICNAWNQQKRWPKAVFYTDNPTMTDTGDIRLRWDIDVSPGIHQELFNHLVDLAVGGCLQFWQWAHDEYDL